MSIPEGGTCRGCARGDVCDYCDGMGCGLCVQTGLRHHFREIIEHILPITADEADEITTRIANRL